MQIKSIQPVYFSPTHTSAKIVTTIAEGMNIIVNKEIDLTYPSTNQKTLPSDTLAIIGVPTYAGRVAPTALERLQKIKGDNTRTPYLNYGTPQNNWVLSLLPVEPLSGNTRIARRNSPRQPDAPMCPTYK